MSIFRAYDIRGIYPEEINESFAEQLGKAFGTYIQQTKQETIAVSGDVRLSTPALKKHFITGLLSTGAHVLDLGMTTTPMLYFAVASRNLAGGMMITASHNPKQYNGFKPVGQGGMCLSWETGIEKVKDILDSQTFRTGTGTVETLSVEDSYVTHLLSKITTPRKLKIVVDAGNGTCGPVAPKVFEKLGHTVVPLYCDPDGNFPNHEANPIKRENLVQLAEKVKEVGADLGIAYDTDGDRLGIVNEQGQVVDNSIVFSLLVKDILNKRPGASIVFEVVMSKVVEDTITRYGGVPILSRVGHSYIQSQLADE